MATISDINILLIGKTGNGKSALGNNILRQQCFRENSGTNSKDQGMIWAEGKHDNKKIEIMECPGVGDTCKNPAERTSQMYESLSKDKKMQKRGYDALLLVLKFGERFTDEEVGTLRFLKQTFGDGFVSDHCVIVMTHGDNFKQYSKRHNVSFQQWCDQQQDRFKDLLQECQGRVVLFDNFAEGKEKEDQLKELLRVIGNMEKKRYTNETFGKAEKSRGEALVESKRPELEAEITKEITKIYSEVKQEEGQKHGFSRYKELSGRCIDMMNRINEIDGSTGVLKDLEERVLKVNQYLLNTRQIQIYAEENEEINEIMGKMGETIKVESGKKPMVNSKAGSKALGGKPNASSGTAARATDVSVNIAEEVKKLRADLLKETNARIQLEERVKQLENAQKSK